MSVAGKVIDAVKSGKIKHFFLIADFDPSGRPQSDFRVTEFKVHAATALPCPRQ